MRSLRSFFVICTLIGAIKGAVACASNAVDNDASQQTTAAQEKKTPAPLRNYLGTGVLQNRIKIDRSTAIAAAEEKTLIFRTQQATYINITATPCASIPGARIRATPQAGQICRGDDVEHVDIESGRVVSHCTLGAFEPLLKTQSPPENNTID